MPNDLRPRSLMRLIATVVCAMFVVAACGQDEPMPGSDGMGGDGMDGMPDDGMDGMPDGGMDGMPDGGMDGMPDDGMGGMAMGDNAAITVAAEAEIGMLPAGPLGWVGYRIDDGVPPGETYAWGPAFLYADAEARTFEMDGTVVTVAAGEAVFVEQGVRHTGADGSFWTFLLTDPDADPAPGLEAATRALSSGSLEGIPEGRAQLRFLVVDLQPEGGQTTVHSHPGPEFVYVTDGVIEYETGLQPTTELTAGDHAALPARTAVQKRNVSDEPARFWSWFIVDPDEPFAAETMFDRE